VNQLRLRSFILLNLHSLHSRSLHDVFNQVRCTIGTAVEDALRLLLEDRASASASAMMWHRCVAEPCFTSAILPRAFLTSSGDIRQIFFLSFFTSVSYLRKSVYVHQYSATTCVPRHALWTLLQLSGSYQHAPALPQMCQHS
jgi:hypothetical protein